MQLAGSIDTMETMYSVLSISHKEKETVGGALVKLLTNGYYGSDINSTRAIGNMEIIKGIIFSNADSIPWNYFFTLGNSQLGATSKDTIKSFQYFGGSLKNGDDSLYIAPVISMLVYKVFKKYDTLYFEEGFELVNQAGEHLAAYKERARIRRKMFPIYGCVKI